MQDEIVLTHALRSDVVSIRSISNVFEKRWTSLVLPHRTTRGQQSRLAATAMTAVVNILIHACNYGIFFSVALLAKVED